MRPAIFLDRDGTLNFDYGWIRSPDLIELLPGAAEAVRAVNQSGYLAVLVTNQPVIGRGECNDVQMLEIHNRLTELLGQSNAHLDGIYYCPHHPDAGCDCRKPAPGLLTAAARDLHIDIARSWMIGDSERDLGAAAALGIPFILVSSNQREFKHATVSEAQSKTHSVAEAVRQILHSHPLTGYY